MKHMRIFLIFAVLLCAALFFTGCPTDPEDEEPNYGGEAEILNIVVAATDGVVYYSLSTGEQVAGTDSWDIAFRRSRLIFTNSGATAAYPDVTSTGSGGVWHVTKTNLADVTVDDAVKDDPLYGPYNQDVVRYILAGGMGGSPATAAPSRINVMTFVGYSNEADNDGLSADKPFSNTYQYNKKQFYNSEGMPPVMSVSNQIYIIKHGDGSKYSKILINAYESSTANGTDTYQIIYQNF
ncbi:MAG: HmuY family protein [Treponema sp.]|jgi:hypothetical protein|nr:HmuY family protein [Treponema sp.]